MIIVVGHEKGGVGKSSLAVNMAFRIAREGARVIVVDTDSTASSIGWYDIRSAEGIQPVIPVVQNVTNPAPAIIDMSSAYDAVVCDIGARDYTKLRDFARIADLWIAPTQVGQSDLDSTRALVDAFRRYDADHKHGKVPLVIAMSRTPVGWNSPEEQDARDYLLATSPGIDLLKASVRDRKVWRDAGRAGRSIYEMPKRDADKAVTEFEALFEEAVSRMSGQGD